MGVSYHAFRRVAAGLLCLLLQQCTHDLPSPAPAPSQPTATSRRFADAIARGEVVMKLEKLPRAAKAPADTTSQKLLYTPCYDYYQVYYDNTGHMVGSSFLYSDCEEGGGPTGDDNGGTWGGGGSGGSGGAGGAENDDPNALSPTTVLVVPPDKPVTNLKQFVKCFDINQAATLTVYVKQPISGTTNTYNFGGGGPEVGHAFISLSQNGITRVFGFYPTSPAAVLFPVPSEFGDDSQHVYDVSITTTIPPAGLRNLLNYAYDYTNNKYSLQFNNCVNFSIGACTQIGLSLPNTQGIWVGVFGGSNPGDLGEDMRVMTLPAGMTRNSVGGTAPNNAGGC